MTGVCRHCHRTASSAVKPRHLEPHARFAEPGLTHARVMQLQRVGNQHLLQCAAFLHDLQIAVTVPALERLVEFDERGIDVCNLPRQ